MKTNWLVKKLGEICTLVRGPFGGSLKKEIFVDRGYKVYEQKNAIYNDFSLGNYFITKDKYLEMKRFEVSYGDLIMSCSGTIGRFAIVPDKFTPGIINQALLKITPNQKVIFIKYLKFVLESSFVQEQIFGNTLGMAIKNVAGVNQLKNLEIPVPPIEEQRRIVKKLGKILVKIEEAKKLQQEQLQKLEALQQSVLHQAFQGELTR